MSLRHGLDAQTVHVFRLLSSKGLVYMDAVVFSSDHSVHMAPKIMNSLPFYDEKLW